MDIPADLLYTDEHEWVNIKGNVATVGITDFAQGELGDIGFIEFPELNSVFEKVLETSIEESSSSSGSVENSILKKIRSK